MCAIGVMGSVAAMRAVDGCTVLLGHVDSQMKALMCCAPYA